MIVIPDEFSLAGNQWRILYVPKRKMIAGGELIDAYGLCLPEDEEILIYKRLGPIKRLQTFIHEAAHAVMFTMGYLEHDEVMVEAMSQLVYQLITTGVVYDTNQGIQTATDS